jgi:hypothetical protein
MCAPSYGGGSPRPCPTTLQIVFYQHPEQFLADIWTFLDSTPGLATSDAHAAEL